MYVHTTSPKPTSKLALYTRSLNVEFSVTVWPSLLNLKLLEVRTTK